MENFEKSKHDKYNTSNSISYKLVRGFFKNIENIIDNVEFNSLVDLGCGEGLLMSNLSHLLQDKNCSAIDYDINEVNDAKVNLPSFNVQQASIYDVPFEDESFDLVVCTEVLEHLDHPEKALEEIIRISNKYIILSVPREPIWRTFNMIRFKYWNALGNTPGHLNHWSTKSFKKFIPKELRIISIGKPLPWTIVFAEKLQKH